MNRQIYNEIYKYLEKLEIPKQYNDDDKKITQLRTKSNNYFIHNRQLYRRRKNDEPQRVILPDQTELIMFNLHKDQSGAHLGIESTYEKVKERYYWPKMYETVREYIRTCENCQKRGKPNRNEEFIPIKIGQPFHRIGIDIKGPLPVTKNGNKYIIVAMDYLTKWPEARAITNMRADTVAKFIYEEIICRHGTPYEILSDRGRSFLNQVIEELCDKFQTKHRLTSAYRPQTNGMVERFNRTIGECIGKLLSDKEKEWDEYLDAVLLAYRTSKHETTGFTPFQLIYGRRARLPVELKIVTFRNEDKTFDEALLDRVKQITDKMHNQHNTALNNIEKSQDRQVQRHKQTSNKLKIGDKILVHRTDLQNNMSAKLMERWIGPYGKM